jgi:hypothetical protein
VFTEATATQKLLRINLRNNARPLGMVVHICNPSFGSQRQEDFSFEARMGTLARPYLQKANTEGEGMA